jgi:hypothetical protein
LGSFKGSFKVFFWFFFGFFFWVFVVGLFGCFSVLLGVLFKVLFWVVCRILSRVSKPHTLKATQATVTVETAMMNSEIQYTPIRLRGCDWLFVGFYAFVGSL